MRKPAGPRALLALCTPPVVAARWHVGAWLDVGEAPWCRRSGGAPPPLHTAPCRWWCGGAHQGFGPGRGGAGFVYATVCGGRFGTSPGKPGQTLVWRIVQRAHRTVSILAACRQPRRASASLQVGGGLRPRAGSANPHLPGCVGGARRFPGLPPFWPALTAADTTAADTTAAATRKPGTRAVAGPRAIHQLAGATLSCNESALRHGCPPRHWS